MSAVAALVRSGNAVRASLSRSGLAALDELTRRDGAASAWVGASNAALKQKGTPISRYDELALEAQVLGAAVLLPAATASSLSERAAAARAWLERARPVMPRPLASGASAEELEELMASARPLLKVAEVDEVGGAISSALKARETWLARCEKLFSKPRCHRPLRAVLRNDTSSEGMWPPTDDENLLCCACCTPETPNVPSEVSWVGCDGCEAWYHSYCVRVPDAAAEALEHFECPRCCGASGRPYAFAPPSGLAPPILTTMRPSLKAVEALVADASAVCLSCDEVDAVLLLLSLIHI